MRSGDNTSDLWVIVTPLVCGAGKLSLNSHLVEAVAQSSEMDVRRWVAVPIIVMILPVAWSDGKRPLDI